MNEFEERINLRSIPKELRTQEVCEFAVSEGKTPGAIRFVPAKLKNYEMCKKAVIRDPKNISYVPVEILTKEFYDEIVSLGVLIPIKHRGYVQECLKLHAGIFEVSQTILSTTSYPEVSDIELSNVAGFFDKVTINYLNKLGIRTLEDLFREYDNPGFVHLFSAKSQNLDWLVPAIRLLRCKYLGEDPMIDMEAENCGDFLNSFGFSNRAYNCLMWEGIGNETSYHIKEKGKPRGEYHLLEIMKSDACVDRFSRIRNMGKKTLEEIVTKAAIVVDYYSKKPQVTDDLNELFYELQRLTVERYKINEQINIVNDKIREKTIGKGGIQK